MQNYGNTHAMALEPYLLAAAMILLLLDACRRCGCAASRPGSCNWLGAGRDPAAVDACCFRAGCPRRRSA